MIQTNSGMKKMVGILMDIEIDLVVLYFCNAMNRLSRNQSIHIICPEVVVELVDEPQICPRLPGIMFLRIVEPFNVEMELRLSRSRSSMVYDRLNEIFQVIASGDILRIRYMRIKDKFL